MSNAMSRSKSRWKGALLAGAALAVVTPLAAKAQSMQLSLLANPLGGGTSPNVYSGFNNVYVDPYDTDTLYVYATVTGTSAPSASYVDGIQFAYFNVNAALTGAAGSGLGSITAAIPTATFGGGNFNASAGNPGAGAQPGAVSVSAYTTTPSIAVGSSTVITNVAKPRAFNDIWNTGAASGSNVVVSGNSVSFLLETLTYTPNSAAIIANPSAPSAANSVAFNLSIPSLVGTQNLATANYFVGLPTTPFGSNPGLSNTSTAVSVSPTNVTLTNALPGDVNLDGTVNNTDIQVLGPNFGASLSGGWTFGDLNDDGNVNNTDIQVLGPNFGASLGGAPSGLGSPTALIAGGSSVPEPASGLLLAGGMAMALGRRRKRI